MISLFDTESSPLPDDLLAKVKPEFEAPDNYSDPEKIKAAIAKKEAQWRERAALDATTGQVLCIGFSTDKQPFGLMDNTQGEKELLRVFWLWLSEELIRGSVGGFNILGFDLPFLCRRSLIHDIHFPLGTLRRGRYWSDSIVDLMEFWAFGNREQRISLDVLSRSLGVGAKNGNGKDFSRLWATDKTMAIDYVRQDMALTRACATRMGF